MLMARIRADIKSHPYLTRLLSKSYSRLLGGNRVRIAANNHTELSSVLMRRTSIVIDGTDNSLALGDMSRLTDCRIFIRGSHNSILIDDKVCLRSTTLHIEDDRNQITIGALTTIEGNTELAAIEGTAIDIGSDCMFSSDIDIRTGDSHSVLDASGVRVNPSRSIRIGNHVWIGTRVIVLKGVRVSDGSIVGAGTVVTKSFGEENIVLAGNPARVVRAGITWLRERVS